MESRCSDVSASPQVLELRCVKNPVGAKDLRQAGDGLVRDVLGADGGGDDWVGGGRRREDNDDGAAAAAARGGMVECCRRMAECVY